MDQIQQEYNNIMSIDLEKSILSADKGHFSKVGWGGRIVRMLKTLFSFGDSFADCRSTHVAKAIVDFALQNESSLSHNQIKNLLQKVEYLDNKFKVKYHADNKELKSCQQMLKAMLANPDFAYLTKKTIV